MEKKKINVSTFLFLISIIVIAVMGLCIYMINTEKNTQAQKATDLEAQVSTLTSTVDTLQGKLDKISNALNDVEEKEETKEDTKEEKVDKKTDDKVEVKEEEKTTEKSDKVSYEFKDQKENKVTIIVGGTSREIELEETIGKTGTIELPYYGTVAFITSGGGESNTITFYNKNISSLKSIDLNADVVYDADYTYEIKDETKIVVTAKKGDTTITSEFNQSAAIGEAKVIDVDGYKVLMVTETGGEYFGIQCYALTQDYIKGTITGIKNIGELTDTSVK